MKKLIGAFLFLSVQLYAQKDTGGKSVVIPRSKEPEVNVTYTPAVAPEKSKFNAPDFQPIDAEIKDFTFKKPNTSFIIGGNNTNKFSTQKEDFKSPYELQRELFPKVTNEGDSKMYRKNQDFGQIKTTSKTLKLKFRDHMAVDGDRVKIMVNSMILVADVSLIASFQTLEIGLTPGFNKIEFEALNQGYSGPNTAQFALVDENGQTLMDNQWDLATGFKGSVLVIKE